MDLKHILFKIINLINSLLHCINYIDILRIQEELLLNWASKYIILYQVFNQVHILALPSDYSAFDLFLSAIYFHSTVFIFIHYLFKSKFVVPLSFIFFSFHSIHIFFIHCNLNSTLSSILYYTYILTPLIM